MNPTRHRAILATSLLAVLGMSCNLLQFLSQNAETNVTQEAQPTTFVIPSVEPSPQPSESCPVSESSPPATFGPETYDILGAITSYVNSGGDFDRLETRIEELGLLIPETPPIVRGDFNGDGFYDLVVSILLPSEEVYPLSGQSHFFLCHQAVFELVYSTPSPSQIGLPRFYAIEDLTGDALTDILLGIENCGAHTCFTSLEALTWTGDSFEDRLQGSSDDLPSPDIDIKRDPTEIIVTGEGVASVGAGPSRRVERHWSWDEDLQSFIPSEDLLLASPFRIHVLHDADQALVSGDLERAVEGYSRVRDDDQLLGWVEPDGEWETLGAYAAFKMMLAEVLGDDPESAQVILGQLRRRYPDEARGSAFREMAEGFWNEFQLTSDIEASCQVARNFAEENAAEILDGLYFGYANPAYSAEDICPSPDTLTQ